MFGLGIVDGILGIGKTVADRLIPDVNKAQDQNHEAQMAQINATTEGEKARNYFTPRAVILYSLAFAVIYGIVIQPFAVAFGLDLPKVDFDNALKILGVLLGVV